jgi:cysteinyl-tRNA synthetase
MKKKIILFFFLIPLILANCGSPTDAIIIPPFIDIKDFTLVINGAEIADIISTTFDLAIIDYSKDGSEPGKYTPAQIQWLKENDTIPIAYFSIGEAEDYRYYWNGNWDMTPPSWLGVENPNWPGNYKVRYWQQGWKDIVFDYLDEIIDLGFSGVMLDIIDGYYYWSDEVGEVSEVFAAKEMIDFVYEIYTYAANKTGNPDFMVFPQNAVEILDYDTEEKYINAISGLSIESLYYKPNGNQTNKFDRANRIEYLERYKNLGKVIMITDYVYPDMNQVSDFYTKTNAQGFMPYAADRSTDLDAVVIINGLQPVD